MAHRTTEIRNDVRDEVERAGAKARFGFTGGGHQVAEIEYSGRMRKVFFSASPSDRNSVKCTLRFVRKALAELGAASTR